MPGARRRPGGRVPEHAGGPQVSARGQRHLPGEPRSSRWVLEQAQVPLILYGGMVIKQLVSHLCHITTAVI